MTGALTRSVSGSANDLMQSAQYSKAPITTYRKEAVLRALSDLEAVKRKTEPEVAQEVVSRHLDRRMNRQSLPPLIADFLDTHWRSYMTQLYVLEGEQSELWRSAIENTDQLTWSLQPKCDEESRQQLYAFLPKLFQWVHTILNSQQVPVCDEDKFFAELARLHVASLHPDTHTVAGSSPSVLNVPTGGDNPKEQSCKRGDVTVDSVDEASPRHSQPAIGPAPEEANAEPDRLGDMVVGALVEFVSKRATKRVLRLEWISRCGGVYLFRDEKRGDALCLTVARFIECLSERSASVLR